jgi:hypothetical protein
MTTLKQRNEMLTIKLPAILKEELKKYCPICAKGIIFLR